MKISTLIICLSSTLIATTTFAVAPTANSIQQQAGYTMGYSLGMNLLKNNVNLDQISFSEGLKDGLAGKESKLSKSVMKKAILNFQKQQMKNQKTIQKKTAKTNLESGKTFLGANKNRPGIITLPDGMQYKVIKSGNGLKPQKNSKITVNYEGRLLNGKVFDSSYKRGKPISLELKSTIPGWQEAILMMKVGSIWELYIPPKLAYGINGVPGGNIGPNETLIFKVELISFE